MVEFELRLLIIQPELPIFTIDADLMNVHKAILIIEKCYVKPRNNDEIYAGFMRTVILTLK